jgi:hypothetical protein
MRYIKKSSASVLAPKLLGIYERELHKVIEDVISRPFQRIVDIGAGEGYYCAGLATRMPRTEIVAYEMNESARVMIKELASLNGVNTRLAIRGVCTIDELNSVLDQSIPTLVICDAEGAESYLLDPIRVPALKAAHIMTELHDVILCGLREVIYKRFDATHDIEQILAESRSRSEFPFKSLLTQCFPSYIDFAISDCRSPGMSWYWMLPKQ